MGFANFMTSVISAAQTGMPIPTFMGSMQLPNTAIPPPQVAPSSSNTTTTQSPLAAPSPTVVSGANIARRTGGMGGTASNPGALLGVTGANPSLGAG